MIPAFLAQRLLVQPDEVPVPGEEVPRVVDGQGVVDVRSDEVVEPRFGTRRYRGWGEGRLGLEALDGVYVGLLFLIA